MKFLSNFDTSLEENLVKEYQESFWVDNVISVHKSRFYYYIYIFFPQLFGYLSICVIIALLRRFQVNQWELLVPIIILVGIYRRYLMHKLLKMYFNYKLDFLIITPKEVIKYDQEGMFSRAVEKINANKVKSVSIRKNGFIDSLFDIGTIVFLAEAGDLSGDGDIKMDYIKATEVERKVRHVLKMDRDE